MPSINELQNPEFLERAAAELKQEVDRIEARAASLRAGEPFPESQTLAAERFPISLPCACSYICGTCCFCCPC
jgi:hypothetical protein